MNENVYEVTFKAKVKITTQEIDKVRKENRNFLTNGYFNKDKRIAKILAYDKAMNIIKTEDESVFDYSVKLVQEQKGD